MYVVQSPDSIHMHDMHIHICMHMIRKDIFTAALFRGGRGIVTTGRGLPPTRLRRSVGAATNVALMKAATTNGLRSYECLEVVLFIFKNLFFSRTPKPVLRFWCRLKNQMLLFSVFCRCFHKHPNVLFLLYLVIVLSDDNGHHLEVCLQTIVRNTIKVCKIVCINIFH